MIHHISIPAANPRHVAELLVVLLDGVLTAFGPYQNSFIAWAGDEQGTAVEVFPIGTEMLPDAHKGQANFRHNPESSPFIATHINLSVKRTAAEIYAIAEREGWQVATLSRGAFAVIEFWLENRILLELMTPEMTAAYLAAAPKR